ncbi:MAG: DUF2141 domain-containing protein [Bacteroidota bacterium]
MKYIFFLLFTFPILVSAQNTLSVEVQGVKNSEGKISVAIYKDPKGFLKFDQVYKSDSTSAKKGTTRLLIEDLPEGEYALAIFHDENGNNELDTNWLGIPKEDIGFSNAKMKTFGPPSFKECSIPLHESSEIKVILQ